MKDPVRFDSFRFRTFRQFIGSVRFRSEDSIFRFGAVRPALFGLAVARSGSFRFDFASGSGRFRSHKVRFGSVGSVRFLVPSCFCVYVYIYIYIYTAILAQGSSHKGWAKAAEAPPNVSLLPPPSWDHLALALALGHIVNTFGIFSATRGFLTLYSRI